MEIKQIKQILANGESIRVEYKESYVALPDNIFESICAMLNRDGGDIILGVDNNGIIKGIEPSKIEEIRTNIINLSNNPEKLLPPFILFPKTHNIDGKEIIHIQIPSSAQVHKTKGVVYDRSGDGDYKIIEPARIANIYNKKNARFSESQVFPLIKFSDFKQDLFKKVERLMQIYNNDHPWLLLSSEQMLKKAGLWRKDHNTQKEGYTLAAVLLFGKDEVIKDILPHYKLDILLRVKNTMRYDDRIYLETNLIDAYDTILGFINKHLPDKFYLQDIQRIDLRSKVFREVVANFLVHQEYTSAYPAMFTIYGDKVEVRNANIANGDGPIILDDFVPLQKNPNLSKFFIQLGRVEELGTGILNVKYWLNEYFPGKVPEFTEGDVFTTVIPIEPLGGSQVLENSGGFDAEKLIGEVLEGVTEVVKARLIKIIEIIDKNPGVKAVELQKIFNISKRTILFDLRRLENFILYSGTKKTGGYILQDKQKEAIKLVRNMKPAP